MTGMESEVSIPQEDPASECNYLKYIRGNKQNQ